MNRVHECSGRTVEEAVESALAVLGVDRSEVEIDVVDEGSGGVLGLFARKEARVRVRVKAGKLEVACEVVKDLCGLLGFDGIEVATRSDDRGDRVEVFGEDVGSLIGRRGRTLEAMQYLVNVISNKRTVAKTPVVVDIDGYRRRREEAIERLATRSAQKARKGRPVRLDPMSAYERRLVHIALKDEDGIRTESVGSEPFRRVVIDHVD